MENKKKLADKVREWFRNISLRAKIILIIAIAGFLPVGCVLVISIYEIQSQNDEQQSYALNQGYEQIYYSIEDKMTNIHNISTLLAVSDASGIQSVLSEDSQDISQQLEAFSRVNSYSYEMEMAFDSCEIIFYIDEKYPVVNEASGRFRSLRSIQGEEWYRKLEENEGGVTWVHFKKDESNMIPSIAVVRKMWSQTDYNKSVGVLVVCLEQQAVKEMLIGANKHQMLYLETGQGEMIVSNVEEEHLVYYVPKEYTEGKYSAFYNTVIDEEEYAVRSQEIRDTGIFLISLVPIRAMKEENNGVVWRMSLLYLCICVLVMLGFIPLTGFVTKRLKLLQRQMEQASDGGICKIEVEENVMDEVGQLIVRYNEMAGKVEESLKVQYALGEEKTGAELKALQSQINPHFLYNTLDMINWMAQKNEMENIRDVVQAMSKFYRLTLSKGHDAVTIGDEIKMCDAYMEIQKRRYKGRINYEVEVEEEILEYRIPKITLQPFIENAIIHGINEKDEARGIIIVNGWMEDGRITLSVTDDGVGMDKNSNDKGTGSHYGMANIQKRLQLFYQEEIQILVESSLGVGTCIIINIPMKK